MGRSRVLSFMSAFGGSPRTSANNGPSPLPSKASEVQSPSTQALTSTTPRDSPAPSTPPRTRTGTVSSRPGSMVFQPAPMEIGRDTLPELQPIFTFLNSHQNKLYQEGYFLKLNDLDTNGRPNSDRNWTECFAQLVGTILSLWDAAALDAAGQDGEVAPTFINLADASIKMIKTLPTRNEEVQPLENVLSISTAGKNRYLLHFNTLHSLTQWTAGIRLAMFEHSSLLELYTGSLIAGKGKTLNNIRTIMERAKLRTEDWCRVRFGAGTPWRRCWCVISPPDEKEYQRQQKSLKKRTVYERPALPKGDIKFYDTKKTKKATPIATITDAYAAYAIYPHSKPLIDASTMVKVEGRIRIHSRPESETEGFVFVMPEVHPAVSGFEMMLRWLFPVYDTFCLYGRPSRLIADTLDPRGIMFAMPTHRRYGYLEIFDVASLLHTDGSQDWPEREWRKKMKELSAKRMTNAPSRNGSRLGSRRGHRNTIYGSVHYDDSTSRRSMSGRNSFSQSTDAVFAPPQKSRTGPPGTLPAHNYHARSVSETAALGGPSRRPQDPFNSRPSLDYEHDMPEILESPPPPPAHGKPFFGNGITSDPQDTEGSSGRNSAESDRRIHTAGPNRNDLSGEMRPSSPPGPVAAPPNFSHQANDKPMLRPNPAPELRRATSRMSTATLSQLVDASKTNGAGAGVAAAGAAAAWKSRETARSSEESSNRGVNSSTVASRMPADQSSSPQGMMAGSNIAGNSRAPPVPAHRVLAPSQNSVNPAIARKPLPGVVKPIQTSGFQAPWKRAMPSTTQANALPGEENEADDSRSSSPDYASTRPSTETKRSEKSVYRQRTGVLKTVGNADNVPENPVYGTAQQGREKVDNEGIPSIDFGPTRALDPGTTQRPSTAAGFEKAKRDPSPLGVEQAGVAGRSGSKERPPLHYRSTSGNTIPWQPGSMIGRQSPGSRAMTPEEFVSERASPGLSGTPIYAHGRNKSSGNLPLRPSSGDWSKRPASGDWSKRPPSGDWSKRKEVPSRPVSRISMSPLPSSDPNTADYSTRLTAQEQEHVARMTGSSFLNLSSNQPATQPSASGLVGAIEAREKEKKAMKEGLSGQMVQQAIYQRQQQAQQAAQTAYSPYQQSNVSQYGMATPGAWPQTPQSYAPPRPLSRNDLYWAGMQSQLDRINNENQTPANQWPSQHYNGHYSGYQNPPQG